MRKPKHKIEDYIILAIPENPFLFGVERQTTAEEKRVLKDPENEVGDFYESVLHIVCPYSNYYTKEKTESCSCLSWRTRQKRCVHLKAFYKKNPHLDKELSKRTSKKESRPAASQAECNV